MNKQLLSTYHAAVKNSFTSIFDDVQNNRLTIKTVFKQFSTISLYALLFVCISFVLLVVRCAKRLIVTRLQNLETNVDDLVHAVATRLEEGSFSQ